MGVFWTYIFHMTACIKCEAFLTISNSKTVYSKKNTENNVVELQLFELQIKNFIGIILLQPFLLLYAA